MAFPLPSKTSDAVPAEGDEDTSPTISWHRSLPFGRGLHKHPIAFVPASHGPLDSTTTTTTNSSSQQPQPQQQQAPGLSVSDTYLSIVMTIPPTGDNNTSPQTSPPAHTHHPRPRTVLPGTDARICPLCSLPLSSPSPTTTPSSTSSHHHNLSLAHQLSLPHSHPPSSLDRSRMGLGVLSAQGWDPDSRLGLGANLEGVAVPVKPGRRGAGEGFAGLGSNSHHKDEDDAAGGKRAERERREAERKREMKKDETRGRLDAGKVRKLAQEQRRRADRIRGSLWGDGRVERYLGKKSGGS